MLDGNDAVRRARDLVAKARPASDLQFKAEALTTVVVSERIAEAIARGDATAIVKSSKFETAGLRFFVADATRQHAIVELQAPIAVERESLADEVSTVKHRMTPGEIAAVAGAADRLFVYAIKSIAPLRSPRAFAWPPAEPIAKQAATPTASTVEPVSKPFSGFETFDACVATMARKYDPESAKRICGKLQAAAEQKDYGTSLAAKRAFIAVVVGKRENGALNLGVGPVGAESAWETTAERDGVKYVVLAKALPPPEGAAFEVGASVVVEVADLLVTAGDCGSIRPTSARILGAASAPPATVAEVLDLAQPSEIKKRSHFFDPHYGREFTFKAAAGAPVATSKTERFVSGIVLEPDVPDSQGDVYSPDAVRRAAHYFLEFHRAIGVMHKRLLDKGVTILESYLVKADFMEGSQLVRKGSWILNARVDDDEEWGKIVRGEHNAWSIGAFGVREAMSTGVNR